MGTTKITILFLAVCGLTLAGCKSEEYHSEKTITLTIASVKPVDKESLYQWSAETSWKPIYIYKRRNADWSIWSAWSPIVGFEEKYEEGYEYVIKVRHRILNNPHIDENPDKYKLEKVVSKVKKDSEGIPDNFISL